MGQAANQWRWEELKLAMSVAGTHPHYTMHGIRRRHFNKDLVERTPAVVAQVTAQLPQSFNQKAADRVSIAARARAAARSAPSSPRSPPMRSRRRAEAGA